MQNIEGFLNKKMDRREFLLFMGMFFLTIFGITNLLTSLSELNQTGNNTKVKGFGSGPYGGTKDILKGKHHG